jgi:selenocysteine lyase/cysteine desulfurase
LNWQRLRSFFPVTRTVAFLDHAGGAPISSRVAEALARFAALAAERPHEADLFEAEAGRVRGRAARLLGAQPGEIAFVRNTTEGLGLVAAGLDWRPGDRVLSCDLEHPSNLHPWRGLAARGVETEVLPTTGGRLALGEVADALASPSVRLLAISSVEWSSGARNDLAALGSLCRDRGVLLCVDAMQSLGCLGLDAPACGVDFLAAGGHKWLLSAPGCGLFYASERLLDRLQPRLVGWRNLVPADPDVPTTRLARDAGRFEEGARNLPGIFALGAALDLLLEISIPAIEARVLALTERLCEGLRRAGAELRSPREAGAASGIVAFLRPGEAPPRSVRRLRERGIQVGLCRGAVRVSPHFYNDEDEIDRLLDVLSD